VQKAFPAKVGDDLLLIGNANRQIPHKALEQQIAIQASKKLVAGNLF
jgi:hypothetical protein